MQFSGIKPRTAYVYATQDQPDNTLNMSFIPDINIAAFTDGYNKLILRAVHNKEIHKLILNKRQ